MSRSRLQPEKSNKNKWVRRNRKRTQLVDKHFEKRKSLKAELLAAQGDLEKQFEIMAKLKKLPKDSSHTRIRNRCPVNGRPRGTYQKVNLCRDLFRKLLMEGKLPGFIMSSW